MLLYWFLKFVCSSTLGHSLVMCVQVHSLLTKTRQVPYLIISNETNLFYFIFLCFQVVLKIYQFNNSKSQNKNLQFLSVCKQNLGSIFRTALRRQSSLGPLSCIDLEFCLFIYFCLKYFILSFRLFCHEAEQP